MACTFKLPNNENLTPKLKWFSLCNGNIKEVLQLLSVERGFQSIIQPVNINKSYVATCTSQSSLRPALLEKLNNSTDNVTQKLCASQGVCMCVCGLSEPCAFAKC